MNKNNTNDLQSKAVNGMMWSSLGSVAFQVIRMVTQIIMARLLWPAAFGIFAIVFAFVSVANYLIENGLTLYLIRKKDIHVDDLSTMFISNFVFSIIIYIIIYFSSYLVSSYFNIDELVWMMQLTALTIPLNALSSVHKAVLTHDLNFKSQTIVLLASSLIAGIISILMAVSDFGLLSLVMYNVLYQLILSVLFIMLHPIKFKLMFSKNFMSHSITYAWKLMISGLIHTVYENIFNVIMASVYSVPSLGFYSNALRVRDGAAQTLTDAIQKVSFPWMSNYQDQENELISSTRKMLKMSLYIIFPLLLGLAATSDAVVNVVFGEQWLGMIPILRVLAFNGLLIPLHKINLNILSVIDRTDLYLKLEVIKKVIAFITITLALILHLDIVSMLWILFLNAVLGYIANLYYVEKNTCYSIKEQLIDIFPIFFISFVMFVLVYSLNFLSFNNLVLFIFQLILGIISYICMSIIFLREEFFGILKIIKIR